MFDYKDKKINILHYGQDTPPILDISTITDVPVAMFVGMEDSLSNFKDDRWARDTIPSVVHYQELENYDHGSFTTGLSMSYVSKVI